jgi:hypothetical protein
VGDAQFEIDLFPDTITVLPDPALHIKYFWERQVFADDPFTDAVEPAIPYVLGVLMHNAGHGVARDMTVVSAQPEIIENEKGLLVDFQIVDSRLNYEEVSSSLSVRIGDIQPENSVAVRWSMVSPLSGEFSNFTAELEYVTPLGDSRLSVVDSLSIHPLIHDVRDTALDDGVPDFLTDDYEDDFIPDTLHSSLDNRVFPVAAVLPGNASIGGAQLLDDSDGIKMELTVEQNTGGSYVYIRATDPATDAQRLAAVYRGRADGGALPAGDPLPGENFWRSFRVVRHKYIPDETEDWLHIFDTNNAGVYTLVFDDQQPVSGLQVVGTTETSITVLWVAPAGANTYKVEVKEETDASLLNSTATSALSAEVKNLLPGTRYIIRVLAGLDGQFEMLGATVEAVTLGVAPTEPPGGSSTTAVSPTTKDADPTTTTTTTTTTSTTSTTTASEADDVLVTFILELDFDAANLDDLRLKVKSMFSNQMGFGEGDVKRIFFSRGSVRVNALLNTAALAEQFYRALRLGLLSVDGTPAEVIEVSVALYFGADAAAFVAANGKAMFEAALRQALAAFATFAAGDLTNITLSATTASSGLPGLHVQLTFNATSAEALKNAIADAGGIDIQVAGKSYTGQTSPSTSPGEEADEGLSTGAIVGIVIAVVVIVVALVAAVLVRRHREPGSGGSGGSSGGRGGSSSASADGHKNGIDRGDVSMERIGEYENPAYAPSNSLSVRRKESTEHLDTCI